MGRRRTFRLSCSFVIGPVVIATAGALLLAPGPAAADPDPAPAIPPNPTVADVRARVEDLYRQAEQASERHNAADERATAAQARLQEIHAQLEARRGQLTALRGVVGKVAASTYRSGAVDPAMLLVFSERPEDFLRRAAALATVSARQNMALDRLTEAQRQQDMDRGEARAQAAVLADSRDELGRERTVMEQRLARRRGPARQPCCRGAGTAGGGGPCCGGTCSRPGVGSACRLRCVPFPIGGHPCDRPDKSGGGRVQPVGQALRLGRDRAGCLRLFGLTGHVWRASGVGLPRTSGAQYAAGRKISRPDLQPGDLVYYYSPISQVGIYIGGGQIIHAPRPGRPVTVAPVDSMPLVGATRP